MEKHEYAPAFRDDGTATKLDSELTCYITRPVGYGKIMLAMEIGNVCERLGIKTFYLYYSHMGNNPQFRIQDFYVAFDTSGDAMGFKLAWENKNVFS
jgi:hypothetical protein